MKNVIKGFAVAASFMAFVACKNDSSASSSSTAAVSAPVTAAPATEPAATAAPAPAATTPAPAAAVPAPTAAATVQKVAPSVAQTASAAVTKEVAAAATPATPAAKTTTMKFDNLTHDWGTIKEGEKMTHVFKFKNTGSNDLIISDARGSCGCTVPEWPKEPIKPGKSGEMKVVFDSSGKPGDQQKTVTVNANTEPASMMLSIKGKVTPKEGGSN
jgi:hypothetical protein